MTGPAHAAAELHGFLAYVVKCCRLGRAYRILGYKGKQLRDNIHARDVCALLAAFSEHPRAGEVYNLGGGRANSVSVVEAIQWVERTTARKMNCEYSDQPRAGDHICYISNLAKLKEHFPSWEVTIDLPAIFRELAEVPLGSSGA